jgi:succinate dehydrogenase / fumarate reductase flavoprotein subunit
MGGVPTNIETQVLRNNTDVVPGLFAAGEVACVSVHGANRLGTNSLLDINVFGRRAGIYAAEYATSADFVDLPEYPAATVEQMVSGLKESEGTERVAAIRKELQETMDMNAQVYRNDETLNKALSDIHTLKERYKSVGIHDKGKRYNTDLLEAVELGFLLELAEVLVVSALARTETRGGHAREDYQTRDDKKFMKHTMAYADPKKGVRLDYKPVTMTRYEPMERKY